VAALDGGDVAGSLDEHLAAAGPGSPPAMIRKFRRALIQRR
jgi:hypothetical protein